MLRLYGGRHDDPAYVERLVPCTELMWDVALGTVTAGSSVVLDWNFWSRERRRRRATRHDSRRRPELHWLDVPVEIAAERARRRLDDPPGDAHEIDEDGVRHFASIFEAPEEAEGIAVIRHR